MFALFSYSCESAQLTWLTMPSRLSCCSWFSLPRLVGFSGPQRSLLFLILRASQMRYLSEVSS